MGILGNRAGYDLNRSSRLAAAAAAAAAVEEVVVIHFIIAISFWLVEVLAVGFWRATLLPC